MKRWFMILGPLMAVAVFLITHQRGLSDEIAWTAAVTALCAVWWLGEPIPIPATSLIPLALFPAVGVLPARDVGAAYGSPLVLLMLGGFMLSAAMEKSSAHRRIAVGMVRLFGGNSARRLVFGFMAASAVLSMWISNAATTLMLLPVVMAVVDQVDNRRLKIALLLGIAYAASVGGVGTPIGTPPNLVFMEVYRQNTGVEPTFLEWMSWALPVVVVMLPLVGWWLTRGLPQQAAVRLPPVGAWRVEEVRTLVVFSVTALLWITRKQPAGGWSEALGVPAANDASVALVAVVTMFLLPNGRGGKLLDWEMAAQIQWGILILFGGGIAIAKAFISSGLADSLGAALADLATLPVLVMLLTVCLAVTFLTEITSNTATTTLLMPILAAAATAAGLDPKLLMIPATISASFAFMLPVATPPNAIVFGSNQLTVRTMAREGLVLNLIGAVVVSTICWVMFG